MSGIFFNQILLAVSIRGYRSREVFTFHFERTKGVMKLEGNFMWLLHLKCGVLPDVWQLLS
jgi:hypothetical protein